MRACVCLINFYSKTSSESIVSLIKGFFDCRKENNLQWFWIMVNVMYGIR